MAGTVPALPASKFDHTSTQRALQAIAALGCTPSTCATATAAPRGGFRGVCRATAGGSL
mgnify:FL=1